MASLWNGSKWVTTRLTDNGSQEFDPVIAAADGKRHRRVARGADR